MIDIQPEIHKNQLQVIRTSNITTRNLWFQPDACLFIAPDVLYLFGSYNTERIVTIEEKRQFTENDAFLQQGDFIGLGNDMFEGAKPLTGEAYDILIKVWEKSLKNTSIIEGML